jgi:hypothetical protein
MATIARLLKANSKTTRSTAKKEAHEKPEDSRA